MDFISFQRMKNGNITTIFYKLPRLSTKHNFFLQCGDFFLQITTFFYSIATFFYKSQLFATIATFLRLLKFYSEILGTTFLKVMDNLDGYDSSNDFLLAGE